MTCIVGVRTPDGAVIGGDSLASTSNGARVLTHAKVFRLTGDIAVGFAGSYRAGQAVQHLEPPPLWGDPLEWTIGKLVPEWRQRLKDFGAMQYKDGAEIGTFFLVAAGNRLLQVQDDFQVLELARDFDACGAAADYALGSLHSTHGRVPRERCRLALEAAAEFSLHCRPPFTFVETTVE